jgi:hypothetical protein
MSSAERQRRYWQRVLQGEAAQPDDAAKAQSAALEQELARARQRIAELEAAVGTQRQPPPFPHPRTAAEWEALKAKATAERKAKRTATAAARRLAAGVTAPLDVPTLLAENDSLRQQLKATQTQMRNLKSEVIYIRKMHDGVVFTPELEKNIRICLHPDWVTDPKQRQRYDKTLAEFNAVMDTKKKGRAR